MALTQKQPSTDVHAHTCNGAHSFNCHYGYSLLADNPSQPGRGWTGLAEVS